MFAVGEETAAEFVSEARASRRTRDWYMRYHNARTPEEAFTACEDVRLWLEELACNVCLDHEGQHCIGEALRDLRVVRTFLSQSMRREGADIRRQRALETPREDG